MAETVGSLIRAARMQAGLTQEQLARKIDNVSASDLSKAERGEKQLTQAALKQIAKATGVTQSSLLQAAKDNDSKKAASSGEKSSVKVTAAEKKLLELYRKADAETKKAAINLLKGNKPGTEDILSNILQSAVEMLSK